VLAPILAPVAMHFGVNLFAACAVARIPLEQVVIRLIPFVLVIFGCLMVITNFPIITLVLRDLVCAR